MEGRPLDEQALIADAKKGDITAYEGLVQMHEQTAFRAAYLVLRDTSLAQDATQEGFIKAHSALGRFDRERPFRPWILRIVTNEARNALKSAQRRGRLAQRFVEDRLSQGDAAPSPESAALGRESQQQVLEAIGALKESDQLAIHMRFFLGLSEAEMATALECRPGTVKSRLSRATARLRELIERDFPDLAAESAGVREG